MIHYVTTDDILQKRVFFKTLVVLIIPFNDYVKVNTTKVYFLKSFYSKQFVYCIRAGKFDLKFMQESDVTVLSVRQEVRFGFLCVMMRIGPTLVFGSCFVG